VLRVIVAHAVNGRRLSRAQQVRTAQG
jgi:hypothetical protein